MNTLPHVNRPHHEIKPPTSIATLVVGGIVMIALCGIVVAFLFPFLLLFSPFILIFGGYVVWALVTGEKTKRKAQFLAAKHLGPSGTTKLNIVESVANVSTLVMNDWGVVFVREGKAPLEVSWNEITLVEEPQRALLRIQAGNQRQFDIDLTMASRYFLVTAAMSQKLPGRTDFDFNPQTGESYLLPKLFRQPRQWQGMWGHFIVDCQGVEYKGKRFSWDEITLVEEYTLGSSGSIDYQGEDTYLKFKANNNSFSVAAEHLEPGGCGIVKSIVQERLAGRTNFIDAGLTPRDMAEGEFNFYRKLYQAPFSRGMREGNLKADFIEQNFFSRMLTLLDNFSLDGDKVRVFFLDYAELLQSTGHVAEAKRMMTRAGR